MRFLRRTATCGAVLGLILPLAALAGDHPDLSGTWVLNEQASDDPAAAMSRERGTVPEREPGGGMKGGGRGGGRGGGGRGGGGRGGSGPGAPAESPADGPVARIRERLATLTVFQAGDELDLTDGLDISRLLRTDGQPVKVWTERGQVLATAQWRDDALEVRWQGGGADRTSRLSLAEDGRQLVVAEELVTADTGRKTTLRLVYERAEVHSGAAAR